MFPFSENVYYDHTILVDKTNNDLTVNLPHAITTEGQVLIIKKIENLTNKIIIQSVDSDEIECLFVTYMLRPYHSIVIQSEGDNWWFLSDYRIDL